jgi:hypothetical protein
MERMMWLSYIGHVSPHVYDEMDPLVANELTNRLLDQRNKDLMEQYEFFAEMVKLVVQSNGARMI